LPRERRICAGRKRPHVLASSTSHIGQIGVEESLAKAKAMEAEAKLLVEEREIMFIDMTNMMMEQKSWVEKHYAIIQQRMRDHT
jgi:hypothetical protein